MWLRSKWKLSHAGGQHYLYIGVVYIPPRGATIEHYSSSLPAYDILQQNIAEVCAAGGVMIVAGDFNARTASAQDLTYPGRNRRPLGFLTATSTSLAISLANSLPSSLLIRPSALLAEDCWRFRNF